MALCTPSEVLAILDVGTGDQDTPPPTDTIIQPFIDLADNLVTNVCVPEGYDSTTLKNIEIWLSAHCYCVMRPRTREEEADGVRDNFDSKVDLGLKVTRYGQMALIFDYKGALARLDYANMNKGKPILSAVWLGKNPRRNPPSGWPPGWPF